MSEPIGPRKLPDRFTCKGCPALKTDSWYDQLDNDETDSGVNAICMATGKEKHITAYWHEDNAPPDWCPVKKG